MEMDNCSECTMTTYSLDISKQVFYKVSKKEPFPQLMDYRHNMIIQ